MKPPHHLKNCSASLVHGRRRVRFGRLSRACFSFRAAHADADGNRDRDADNNKNRFDAHGVRVVWATYPLARRPAIGSRPASTLRGRGSGFTPEIRT